MKVNFDTLKAFGLYEILPDKLKSLKSGQFYCFYYVPDYDNSKINIVKDFVAVALNTSLYQNISQVYREANSNNVYLGYFKDSFETRDGLFYLFLNSFTAQEKVTDFYAYASSQDDTNELKISNYASIEILSREFFLNALAYFSNNEKLNDVISIYDIVDEYCKINKNTSLYTDLIKKVVQIYTHDSGVLLEENGDVRFMIIGEKANLTEEQREKLNRAKLLLRSLENPNDIYIQTGWFLNINDGVWRTNISDKDSSIDESLMIEINESLKIYKPNFSPVNQETLVTNIKNPIVLLNSGYNGVLSDILKHEKLYQVYPQLSNLPLIYGYLKGSCKFYFDDSYSTDGYINILGDNSQNHIHSILLHETQHAIQHIENFATGGNSHFADFVIALGGKNVRKIFSMIGNFQSFIEKTIRNEDLYEQLKSGIQKVNAISATSRRYKSIILNELMTTYEIFNLNRRSVGFYIVYLISDTKTSNDSEVIDFLEKYYGYEIYYMFEDIKDAIGKADMASEELLKKFSKEDVSQINFNQYKDLLGEMEARGTQHQMRIPINLTNYFYLNEWEKSPTKSIAVIGGNYVVSDTSNIVGACEKSKQDGRYILHFKKSNSCIPFIHELGHIVYDILVEEGFEQAIKNEYDKENTTDNYQEYFVNVFLGYINENYKDSVIGKDFEMMFSIKSNDIIFQILSKIFNPVPKDLTVIKEFMLELEKML